MVSENLVLNVNTTFASSGRNLVFFLLWTKHLMAQRLLWYFCAPCQNSLVPHSPIYKRHGSRIILRLAFILYVCYAFIYPILINLTKCDIVLRLIGMRWINTLHYEILCTIMSCRIVSYRTVSYRTIPYRIVSYLTVSYHIASHRIVSYHIISYHIMSCHVMSCHVMSCHVISYHIISYHTLYIKNIHHMTSHHGRA